MIEFDLDAVLKNDVPFDDVDEIVSYFTEGQCYELAVGLRNRYGWPVWLMGDEQQHVVVQAGEDRFVDITGVSSKQELLDAWSAILCWGNDPVPFVCMRAQSVGGLRRYFAREWLTAVQIGKSTDTGRTIQALEPQIRALGLPYGSLGGKVKT